MENYIEGRAILGILCIIHLFLCYACQAPWGHIKAKILDSIFLTELIAVTVYIIYDNVQAPPYDGWFLASIGYLFVYTLIFTTWSMYGIFALLDKDKIYEITIYHHVSIMNKDYFKGTVIQGKHKHEVYLPYSSELDSWTKINTTKPKVKFDNVIRGMYIVVKRV